MRSTRLFLWGLVSVALLGSCKRDENVPLLSTPDPSVSSVSIKPRGTVNNAAPEFSILLQTLNNSGGRMTDLSQGNFVVIHDGTPEIVTGFSSATSEPFAVMLVIDRSGSMTASFGGGTRTDAVNSAAVTFLDSLPAGAQAGLVEFDNAIQVTVPMTSNLSAVKAAVLGSSFGGGATAAYDAFVRGGWELAKVSGKRLLILMTDGDDNSSVEFESSPYGAGVALQQIGLVANCVLVDSDVTDTTSFQTIVDLNEGTLSTSLDPDDLEDDLNATLTGGQFDDIYALTFRRRNTSPYYTVRVQYGSETDDTSLITYR